MTEHQRLHEARSESSAIAFVETLIYPDHVNITEVFGTRYYALPGEYRFRALILVDRIRRGDDKAKARKVAFELTDSQARDYFADDPDDRDAEQPESPEGKGDEPPSSSPTASPTDS